MWSDEALVLLGSLALDHKMKIGFTLVPYSRILFYITILVLQDSSDP